MEILSLIFPSHLSEDKSPHSHEKDQACSNCGTAVHGHYCHHCGQKQRTPHDYRLLHFVKTAFHEFTDLDSKVFRSLRYLLFRPGKLSAEWHAGREGGYLKPLRLFLFVNVLYFIFFQFYPVSTIVNPLDVQYNDEPYSHLVRHIVDERLGSTHEQYRTFAKSYDELSATESKTLVVLMVPMFALLLAILYIRWRRYFVQHLVFSLHYYSFFLVLISVGSLAINLLIIGGFHLLGVNAHQYTIDWDEWISYSDGVLILAYLTFALRAAYGGKFLANVMRSALLTYATLYVLWAYRFILFFTTFYSMSGHKLFS